MPVWIESTFDEECVVYLWENYNDGPNLHGTCDFKHVIRLIMSSNLE